jgi:hypothetical protein
MSMQWELDESDPELDEAYDDSSDESDFEAFDEARRTGRRPPRPVPTAGRRSAFRPRPPAGATSAPVTQAQLQAALARVGQQMNTNSTAIKTIDGRVRTVTADQAKLGAMVRRETTGLRRDLQSTREMIALVGLLFPPGSSGSKFAPLAFMLPPDFLSGAMGGQSQSASGQSGGGMLGGNNGMVALIAVAAATGLFK